MHFCLLCNEIVKRPLKHLKLTHKYQYDSHISKGTNFFREFRKPTAIEIDNSKSFLNKTKTTSKKSKSLPDKRKSIITFRKNIYLSETAQYSFIWEDINFKISRLKFTLTDYLNDLNQLNVKNQ